MSQACWHRGLALSVVQLAKLEHMTEAERGGSDLALPLSGDQLGAIESLLGSLKARITEREKEITTRDLAMLAREIENRLLSEVVHVLGASSCMNCNKTFECSQLMEVTQADDPRCNVYDAEAATLCTEYGPCRDALDTMSLSMPIIFQKIANYGIPVDVRTTSEKMLTVIGTWLLDLEKAGKPLPAAEA